MFPIKKKLILNNNSEFIVQSTYVNHTEIPLLPHPGAFGKERKNHIHEGIDLYCENGDCVYCVDDGTVINMGDFTGEKVGSPWWNDTSYVLVEHNGFILNYGEIIQRQNIFVGKKIRKGEILGEVKTVLKKDKGRPMSMLHLEMYELGTKSPVSIWKIGDLQPSNLLNPTLFIQNLSNIK